MSEKHYKPIVYLETTILSYLTAWPSRDILRASHQQITRQWWRSATTEYQLVISQTVLDEISGGDPSAAAERLLTAAGMPVLAQSSDVKSLAEEYFRLLALPAKAYNDAVHLAYAVLFEVDYIATWNMRHLANGLTIKRLTEFNNTRSLYVPLIVTPEYLVQDPDQEQ